MAPLPRTRQTRKRKPRANPLVKDLGEVIKNLRLETELSQEQLGKLCGLNRAYIGTIERGEKAITVETASRIANGLSVKLSAIISRVENLRSDTE